MGKLKITECPIDGLFLVKSAVYTDERGFFTETYSRRDFIAAGLGMNFVQDNFSRSSGGVLRGMHFQKRHPQGKLVRAAYGAVFDAAVDLRPGSRTYGHWYGAELSAENGRALYIPEGFAHGFLALSAEAGVAYKASDYYCPGDEGGLCWDDPDIGVEWPLAGVHPLLSAKDAALPRLRELS